MRTSRQRRMDRYRARLRYENAVAWLVVPVSLVALLYGAITVWKQVADTPIARMITGLTVKANALACVSVTLTRLMPETPAMISQMRFQYLFVDKGGVSAVGELVSLVRERRGAEPRFLMMDPADLRDPAEVSHDANAFPPSLPLSTSVRWLPRPRRFT